MKRRRVGTRASELARTQTEEVAAVLRAAGYVLETELITTVGDRDLDARFSDLGPDIFTRALDEALLEGRIDFAVHSAKDVPTELPDGVDVCAYVERLYPEDVLVGFTGAAALDELPPGARVGTSSLRRRALLLGRRPDLQIVDLRGNVRTRLDTARASGLDAAVLARAGLRRLDLGAHVTEILDPDTFVPQAGQGALAVSCRSGDALGPELRALVGHEDTRHAVTAERAFLSRLGGGCQIPAGAYARCSAGRIDFRGVLLAVDGCVTLRAERSGPVADAAALGGDAAAEILRRGGDAIVRSVRGGGPS